MRRRPATKTELLARMPRAFRERLAPVTLRDLALCHHSNVDAIVRGDAAWQVMWDFVGSVLTWWRTAQVLQAGVPEMDVQMQVATRLVHRYTVHGVVRFDGPDLQLARDGLIYMDQLAALVDRPTALEATAWAEAQVQQMAGAVPERTQQGAAA